MGTERERIQVRGNLGVMMLTSGIWTFGGQLAWPFRSLYVLSLGGTYFDIGLISAIGSVFGVLPSFLGGYLADTLGRKKMLYSMSFLLAVNSLIYFAAPTWHWLILATAVDSIASGLRGPAFNALVADSTIQERRAESYALLNIVPPLFGIFSPYIIGVYMDRWGVLPAQRAAFLVLFGASMIASFMRFRFISETLPEEEREQVRPSQVLRETFTGIRETTGVMSRPLWVLTAMGMLFGVATAIGSSFYVTYATGDVIHLTNAQWGFISTVNMVINTLVTLPFARLADQRGRRALILLSLALTPPAIVAFVLSEGFTQVLAVNIFLTVLGSMGGAASQALFVDHSPREHRGRINALWSVMGTVQNFKWGAASGSIIGAAGSLLGGYLYGNVSMALPLYLNAGLIGVAALIGVAMLREPERKTG